MGQHIHLARVGFENAKVSFLGLPSSLCEVPKLYD